MARFLRVGEVFSDALYGHIIVSFNRAELRGQMKDLQKGISYRQERARQSTETCATCLKRTWLRATRSWRAI
jgi:hypothetical protein